MEESEVVEQPAGDSAIEDRLADHLFGGEDAVEGGEDTPAGAEAVEQADTVEGAQAQAEALEDVEFNGKTYKLPPELKPALMQQSDYTRKTQEVAEQRRMLDYQILMQQQEGQFQQAVAPEYQQLTSLDSQLAQYRQLDWTALDLEQATRYRLAVDKLKDDRETLIHTIEGKRGEFGQKLRETMAQAKQKGDEYLARHIPNYGPDVQKAIAVYGQKEGYSDVELGTLTDARMIKTLWKAQQWDHLQSQKAASKPAASAPPIKPPGASPNQAKAQTDAQYRDRLAKAKSPGRREAVIGDRVAAKLGL